MKDGFLFFLVAVFQVIPVEAFSRSMQDPPTSGDLQALIGALQWLEGCIRLQCQSVFHSFPTFCKISSIRSYADHWVQWCLRSRYWRRYKSQRWGNSLRRSWKILEILQNISKRFGIICHGISGISFFGFRSLSRKVCEEFCAEVFWFSVKAAQYLFCKPCWAMHCLYCRAWCMWESVETLNSIERCIQSCVVGGVLYSNMSYIINYNLI